MVSYLLKKSFSGVHVGNYSVHFDDKSVVLRVSVTTRQLYLQKQVLLSDTCPNTMNSLHFMASFSNTHLLTT